jgi:hypothetical protein
LRRDLRGFNPSKNGLKRLVGVCKDSKVDGRETEVVLALAIVKCRVERDVDDLAVWIGSACSLESAREIDPVERYDEISSLDKLHTVRRGENTGRSRVETVAGRES